MDQFRHYDIYYVDMQIEKDEVSDSKEYLLLAVLEEINYSNNTGLGALTHKH